MMTPTKSDDWYSLYLGRCLDVMPFLAPASVDVVLCDLPYGTTQNAWDIVIPFAPLWAEYARVTKSNAAFLFTASQPFTSELVMSKKAWFKHEWIWKKNTATGHLNAKVMPMKQHENVLVFARDACPYFPQGLLPFNKMAHRGGSGGNFGEAGTENFQEFTNYPRSILNYDSVVNTEHSTEKPVSLMSYLIRTYSRIGATVLDNTMGSGSTGVAALRCHRRFIGIESDDNHFSTAANNMEQTTTLVKEDIERCHLSLDKARDEAYYNLFQPELF